MILYDLHTSSHDVQVMHKGNTMTYPNTDATNQTGITLELNKITVNEGERFPLAVRVENKLGNSTEVEASFLALSMLCTCVCVCVCARTLAYVCVCVKLKHFFTSLRNVMCILYIRTYIQASIIIYPHTLCNSIHVVDSYK